MSSSGGAHSYGYPIDDDVYNPEQQGLRGIAGRDGWATNNYSNDPPSYDDYNRAPRRRSSVGALDDYYRRGGSWGDPGERDRNYNYDRRTSGRGRRDDYDESSDDEYADRKR